MAREPGKVVRPAWKSSAETREVFAAFLERNGEHGLLAFYRRHGALMERAAWTFVRGAGLPVPSVSSVLEQAARVAERERVVLEGVEPVLCGSGPVGFADAGAGAEWRAGRMEGLRRFDRKAYVASCKDALAHRWGVFEFEDAHG